MKQAYYEDEGIAGVCSILESSDLDEMTDEQLQEELGNWCMSLDDDDPFAWEVAGNYRLIERHIELRGMSDEKLAKDLEQAEWAIGYWQGEFDKDKCSRSLGVVADRKLAADRFRRELARRERAAA